MHQNKLTISSISKVIWKNIIAITICTIIFGLLGGLYAKHKKHTVYVAQRSFMVNHPYQGVGANEEVQADINLGKTFAKIAESKDVAEDARKRLPTSIKKKYSVEELTHAVNAHPVMQTTIVKIDVKANTSKSATAIVNAVTDASVTQIKKKVPVNGRITAFAKTSESEAESNTSPSIKKYSLLGAAVGFLLGMVVSFSITTWTKLI